MNRLFNTYRNNFNFNRLKDFNSLQTIFCRSLFIQTQETPNPNALKFLPGKEIMTDNKTVEFHVNDIASHKNSSLARRLFKIEGVRTIFLGNDFVSVTISSDYKWGLIKPQVFASMMDFFVSGKPVFEQNDIDNNEAIDEEEDEVILMIKELIETRIRPAIQGDGGDIAFLGFEDGIVKVQLQGSCVGCPSSSITLKNGIETMLMRYIPEVEGIEHIESEFDEVSNEAFRKLEEGLKQVKKKRKIKISWIFDDIYMSLKTINTSS